MIGKLNSMDEVSEALAQAARAHPRDFQFNRNRFWEGVEAWVAELNEAIMELEDYEPRED